MNMPTSELQLPFVIDETLRCYLCNAFWGGILSAYGNMEEWVAEHYIQLFYVSKRLVLNTNKLESQLNYYGGWSEPIPLFDQQYVTLGDVPQHDIVQVCRAAIVQGFYCYTYINEKYTGKDRDTAHDVFVIGKNDRTRQFQVVGYFNRHYTMQSMDYELFTEAFVSGVAVALTSDNAIEDYVKMFRPRFNTDTRYSLNLQAMMTRTREYVDSINTGLLNQSTDPNHHMYEMPYSYYGLSLYQPWKEELLIQESQPERIDYRKFHAVYEHKLMMMRRLDVLEKKYGSRFHTETTLTQHLIDLTTELRMLALKYNQSFRSATLVQITQRIDTIQDVDQVLMSQFLATLESL